MFSNRLYYYDAHSDRVGSALLRSSYQRAEVVMSWELGVRKLNVTKLIRHLQGQLIRFDLN